jgi:hypothetical protein
VSFRRVPRRHRRRYARAVLVSRRFGFAAVFVARFLSPLRAIAPIAAGVTRMPELRFQAASIASALVWRSRELDLPATRARVNFAVGEGISYALSRPTFEGLENNERPRKFLNYLAFEAEISHPALAGVSLVSRLHHRSGIFGLIAPQGSGSNILGLGLRITLQ